MTPEQQELAEYMSEISENYYCAGWLHGLEYRLWAMLQGGNTEFGFGEVREFELNHLRDLSDRCGGWIRWVDREPSIDSGETFVPMAEWLTIYEKGQQ